VIAHSLHVAASLPHALDFSVSPLIALRSYNCSAAAIFARVSVLRAELDRLEVNLWP